MKTFQEPDRQQQLLFTEVNLDSIIEKDSPAYIIDQLVSKLDTTAIEDQYNLDIWQGVNPLHPKTYIKVCLLAIHNCRFSLRKIEHDTQYNLVYRWITGDKAIDHSTIGKFLNRFKVEISELFGQVIQIAKEEGLLDFDLLAIDTVKIRANASYKRTKNLESIKKQLQDIIENAEQTNEKEKQALEKRMAKLRQAKELLEARSQENPKESTINPRGTLKSP